MSACLRFAELHTVVTPSTRRLSAHSITNPAILCKIAITILTSVTYRETTSALRPSIHRNSFIYSENITCLSPPKPHRGDRRVYFARQQNSTLPFININYSTSSVGITTNVECLSTPPSAFLDTGAAINLIKLETFKELFAISSESLIAFPPDLNIHGISGSKVLPHGKV